MKVRIPIDLERRLLEVANARGLAPEEFVRVVLERAVKRVELLSDIDRIRAMTPLGSKVDSGHLLTEVRDERYGR